MFFSKSVLATATLWVGSTLSAPAASTSHFCHPQPANEVNQERVWNEYVNAVYIKQNIAEAFKYIDSTFIQHNVFSVGQGAASSEHQIETVWPQSNVSPLYNIYSNGFGWAHTEVFSGPIFPNQTSILDMYRFEGGCIVEHWDSIQVANQYVVKPAFPN